jgi:hypothetical protein
MKVDPVPGCSKIYGWTSRIEARAELLRRWKKGNQRCNGTYWCKSHEAFHLTSHAEYRGKNYLYRD